ncbi:TolC family protein [Spirosoma sp. KCTC 42546]|uniref:TolC family protein n=1 Tax=Spirosoma sp. KCTC 42546 TaxID=2520506 RepID=UPI00115BA46F|nr:TolC family protein [Spirosoma sp. KCTC 42546]QDK82403.1 TolC family protein [Spirosoma sp. KCTC 42546]
MKQIVTLLLALGLSGTGWGQSTSTSLPTSSTLTLEQCITLALENQPSIRQSILQQQVADNTVEQTRRSQLPTLSGYSNQGLNFGRNVDPYTNSVTNAQITTNTAGLGVSWTVFNGFQLKNTLLQQSFSAQASQFDVATAKNTITLNTLLAYLQVLTTQDLVLASEVQVSVAQAQVERTEKLVKSGTTPPFNLYDAKSQLANDQMQLVQAQTNLKAARLTLLQVLNLPSTTVLQLVRLEGTTIPQVSTTDAYQIFTQARTFMPEVQAADLRTKAAQKGLDLAKGLAYPTLTVNANWGTSYSSAARRTSYSNEVVEQATAGFVDVGGQSYPVKVLEPILSAERINYFQQLDNNQYKSVTMSIRIPILNGFQVRYRTTNARLQQQLAESQAESVRRNLRQAIDQAVNQQQNANERYHALEQQVAVLAQSHKAAEARYNAGLLNAVEYNLAKSNLDRASVNLIQARYERVLREKVVDFYRVGTL